MNFKRILEKLGLIENVDFSLTESFFIMLDKTRDVQNIVHHEATPAIYEEIEGEQVLKTPAVEAYDELVITQEQYTPDRPSDELLLSTWETILKEDKIKEVSIELCISEYLKNNEALKNIEKDCLHVIDGKIEKWDFENIPMPSLDDLYNLTSVVQKNIDTENKKMLGKKARIACQNCLDLIAGNNLNLNLTGEQITQQIQQFTPIQMALMNLRPTTAKHLINSIIPDGILITENLKESVLNELKDF